MRVRETAIAQVAAIREATDADRALVMRLLNRQRNEFKLWRSADETQSDAITELNKDLGVLADWFESCPSNQALWAKAMQFACIAVFRSTRGLGFRDARTLCRVSRFAGI